MMTLQNHIAERPARSILFRGMGDAVSREQALAFRPAMARVGNLLLSMTAPDLLIRTLCAFDGRCLSMMILSGRQPPEEVRLLAGQMDNAIVISDRADLGDVLHPDKAVITSADGAMPPDDRPHTTQWLLTTSGTTGLPKVVLHVLGGLTRTVRPIRSGVEPPIWGLTYDPARFAGLQVVLQAVCGGGTVIALPPGTPLASQLRSFAQNGVTHISATPSLWRQFLMHPESRALKLRQITLGGEIADQPLLDRLGAQFPDARVTHIYASTEAGVGFSVQDGREGFPVQWLDDDPADCRIKVVDDTLWVCPSGPSGEYLGDDKLERDADGFINTHDRLARMGDRLVFLGRATGAVNVAGAKVYPEFVEQVLNVHPAVALSCISGRKNPFSGNILIARVVPLNWPEDEAAFRKEILRHCNENLPREAVPALIQLVRELKTNSSGKISRT